MVSSWSDDPTPLLDLDPTAVLAQPWLPYNQITRTTLENFQKKYKNQRSCSFIYAVDADSPTNSTIYLTWIVVPVILSDHNEFKIMTRYC